MLPDFFKRFGTKAEETGTNSPPTPSWQPPTPGFQIGDIPTHPPTPVPSAAQPSPAEGYFSNFYKTHIRGDHEYDQTTPVHFVPHGEDVSAKQKEAFEHLTGLPTPGRKTQAATEDGTLNAVPILGDVTSFVNSDNQFTQNVTEPNHLLHPGEVSGRIVSREVDGGTQISVNRHGTGSGWFPSLNNALASRVWSYSDSRIADAMNGVNKKDQPDPDKV